MKKFFRSMAVATLLLGSAVAASAYDHQTEEWFQVTATGPVYGRLLAFAELQPRFGENPQTGDADVRAFIARGALGWQVMKGWTLWQGYGYTPVYDPDRDEHRFFQQSTVDWMTGPFKSQWRARLEERLLQHEQETSVRLRNQLRFVYPLPRFPDWGLVAADEVFFDLNSVKSGSRAGFDQNRLFLGVSYQVNKHVRVEVDYLNQVVNRTPNKEDVLRNSVFMQVALGW